jgi:LuxR family maltose regulon positive regulatory protein
LSAHDDLSYLREFEHITLARVLLARYKSDREERSMHETMGLLERLLTAAEEGGRMGRVIEILVLRLSLTRCKATVPAALVPLERALTLAEPEGYVRIFVDEGSRWLACSTKPSLTGLNQSILVGCWQHSLLPNLSKLHHRS